MLKEFKKIPTGSDQRPIKSSILFPDEATMMLQDAHIQSPKTYLSSINYHWSDCLPISFTKKLQFQASLQWRDSSLNHFLHTMHNCITFGHIPPFPPKFKSSQYFSFSSCVIVVAEMLSLQYLP